MSLNIQEATQVLQGLQEWSDFVVEIEKAVITVLTDGNKQAWYGELIEIVMKLVDSAIPVLSKAISDSKLIGEQWAATSTQAKVMFFINLAVQHGMTIADAFFKKDSTPTV